MSASVSIPFFQSRCYDYISDDYSGSSPELYVDEPSSSKIAPTSLREKVEADSQADKIRDYIDASLSEAY